MLTGDCWRGMSKNEGAFKDVSLNPMGSGDANRVLSGPPSRSIRSGVSSRAFGLDLGDGYSWASALEVVRSTLGRVCALGVDAKCWRFPWLSLKPLCSSDCLRKASYSLLDSRGMRFGEFSEMIELPAGLQPTGPAAVSRPSLAGSTTSPK